MKDSGYGETLCLELGGTNERTSSKAELVEVQRPTCVGGVRGGAWVDAVAGASPSLYGGCDVG